MKTIIPKKPLWKGHKKSWRRPTLARPGDALPSAMEPLTSVFGMGTGMAAPPWPPAKGRGAGDEGREERHTRGREGPRAKSPRMMRGRLKKQAKPHVRLVPISSTDRSACTFGLSRSSSTTGLQGLASGRTCLGGGLALRCLQRLSVPGIATGPAAGATARTPWARHSRSSRTRECSRQPSCAHRG